jgi:CheY-like chemotaxis protein
MFLPSLSDGGPREVINESSTAGAPRVSVKKHSHAKVLVAAENQGLRSDLVFRLRRLGCLVLEADTAIRAIEFVISHSRPIQALLADKNLDDVGLMERMKRYRPQMHILLVTGNSNESGPDVLAMDAAVAKTRELLDLPKRRAPAT